MSVRGIFTPIKLLESKRDLAITSKMHLTLKEKV
jgi:hypothetical protein